MLTRIGHAGRSQQSLHLHCSTLRFFSSARKLARLRVAHSLAPSLLMVQSPKMQVKSRRRQARPLRRSKHRPHLRHRLCSSFRVSVLPCWRRLYEKTLAVGQPIHGRSPQEGCPAAPELAQLRSRALQRTWRLRSLGRAPYMIRLKVLRSDPARAVLSERRVGLCQRFIGRECHALDVGALGGWGKTGMLCVCAAIGVASLRGMTTIQTLCRKVVGASASTSSLPC